MQLGNFLLDHWLDKYTATAETPIEYDLAASTGPHWTFGDVLELLSRDEKEEILQTDLVYAPIAGSDRLREEIADMSSVRREDVQVCTGASEALLCLFFLASEPGGNVLVPFPVFQPIVEVPRSLGLEVRFYELNRENHFQPDVEEIRRLVDGNTKVILTNSPHNPTGSVTSTDTLDSIHDLAAERGIQLVVDEVYHPVYHDADVPSATRLEEAIVIGDFSKALSMSGLRLGWVADRDHKRLAQLQNAKAFFTISSSAISERLGVYVLEHREEILERTKSIAEQNLELLDQFMDNHRDTIEWVRPNGGMSAFPWFVDGRDARTFCESMVQRGVLLVPGDCYEMASHFRLGFGASSDGFPKALERIADVIR